MTGALLLQRAFVVVVGYLGYADYDVRICVIEIYGREI